jgi:hypothetical protein
MILGRREPRMNADEHGLIQAALPQRNTKGAKIGRGMLGRGMARRANAAYCGIGHLNTGDSLNTAQIFGNTIGQGVNFHVQLTYTNSFGWFLGSNTYYNASGTSVPLFTDPASSAIHIYQ